LTSLTVFISHKKKHNYDTTGGCRPVIPDVESWTV